jgi:hypothetical protein
LTAFPVSAVTSDADVVDSLLSANAVRERAHRMLALGIEDSLPHFRIDMRRLDDAIAMVQAITLENYPKLDVPFHSRWRHFVIGGADRWAAIADRRVWRDGAQRARAEIDLAMVSVLLDAGAGPRWRYRDPVSGESIGRSEGLALASLAMFAEGAFSADPADPLRADAAVLAKLSAEALRAGFQVSDGNPLIGLEGRATLLRSLGRTVCAVPNIFATRDMPRPGGLLDRLVGLAGHTVAAPVILAELLHHLGPIWPSRLTLLGIALGDCWKHPSLVTNDLTSGLVPLHKLSQWLAYSLIEPLQTAGLVVTDVDGLTGLAEYRNGGLFIDTGVLTFRERVDMVREHDVSSMLVVEWRALTVALLDRLAEGLRKRLGLDAVSLPLAKVLQGGTWAAGRRLAHERRADGAPPIKVVSDGTVF